MGNDCLQTPPVFCLYKERFSPENRTKSVKFQKDEIVNLRPVIKRCPNHQARNHRGVLFNSDQRDCQIS